MTDYPQNSMSKEFPEPLSPLPQVAHASLRPMPQVYLGPEPCMVPLSPMPQVAQVPLGPESCMVTCPSCGASIRTTVTTQAGTHTHLMALLLCLICVCCACIPYFVDSCQNAEHHCPNCNAYLGTHKR